MTSACVLSYIKSMEIPMLPTMQTGVAAQPRHLEQIHVSRGVWIKLVCQKTTKRSKSTGEPKKSQAPRQVWMGVVSGRNSEAFEEAVVRTLWWFNEGCLADVSCDRKLALPDWVCEPYPEEPGFVMATFQVDIWMSVCGSVDVIAEIAKNLFVRYESASEHGRYALGIPKMYADDIVGDDEDAVDENGSRMAWVYSRHDSLEGRSSSEAAGLGAAFAFDTKEASSAVKPPTAEEAHPMTQLNVRATSATAGDVIAGASAACTKHVMPCTSTLPCTTSPVDAAGLGDRRNVLRQTSHLTAALLASSPAYACTALPTRTEVDGGTLSAKPTVSAESPNCAVTLDVLNVAQQVLLLSKGRLANCATTVEGAGTSRGSDGIGTKGPATLVTVKEEVKSSSMVPRCSKSSIRVRLKRPVDVSLGEVRSFIVTIHSLMTRLQEAAMCKAEQQQCMQQLADTWECLRRCHDQYHGCDSSIT
jgi:hypothetical protein